MGNNIIAHLIFFPTFPTLRAFTSALLKDSVYFTQKTYFFYFTSSLLQNTHISLSILQDISIKYSFFINFLLFSLMVILF